MVTNPLPVKNEHALTAWERIRLTRTWIIHNRPCWVEARLAAAHDGNQLHIRRSLNIRQALFEEYEGFPHDNVVNQGYAADGGRAPQGHFGIPVFTQDVSMHRTRINIIILTNQCAKKRRPFSSL